MSNSQDDEIVRGLHEGNPDAWSALYEQFFAQIWQCVARLLGPDTSAVSDVVQETFLAAARSARGYNPARGPLGSWLGGIARNHAGTYLRNKRREGRIRRGGDLCGAVAEQLGQWLNGRTALPEEVLASSEAAELVRITLGELSDDHRTVLMARYCDGASVQEIAGMERASVMAVRSRLARARRAFRTAFAKYSEDSPTAK